jgi:hypothetical protein
MNVLKLKIVTNQIKVKTTTFNLLTLVQTDSLSLFH